MHMTKFPKGEVIKDMENSDIIKTLLAYQQMKTYEL